MYIISVMIFTFSIRDFGHPQFLKSQFRHPIMKNLAKSLGCRHVEVGICSVGHQSCGGVWVSGSAFQGIRVVCWMDGESIWVVGVQCRVVIV